VPGDRPRRAELIGSDGSAAQIVVGDDDDLVMHSPLAADMQSVDAPTQHNRHSRRVMAYCGAAMYGAAAVDGLIELVLPNVPHFAMLPIYVVLALFVLLMTVGQHLPRGVLALNGPLGVALVAYALATTSVTASDSAVLYALPVLWQSLFFGRRGAIFVLVCVAIGDALALVALGPYGYPERWFDVMVSVTAIAVVVRALEERNERLVQTLRTEARVDPLTGLLNRRGFDERAAVELGHVTREARPFVVVVFDIDHFKLVNDEWGHEIGDRVLQRVGALLSEHARTVDVLARFGGEEFVVMLPDTDVAGGQAFADRVRHALAASHGGLPAVRLSAGVRASRAAVDITALLADADLALYEAKRTGRDRTRVYAAV
jgi:diguanylate cyclase (GGDEF)-like protein